VNQLKDLMALSMTDRPPETTAVIWAESAVPMYAFINVSADYRRVLTTAAPADGYLITGGNRLVAQPPGFNSLYVLKAGGGDIAAYYDKLHLVPFGEYIPLHWLIPFDKIIGGLGDYTAGSALVTITVPGLPPFTPLICYDTIFSGVVTPSDGPRPKWLLEVTNDAWFGASTGPYQHLAADRLRAVEEGLPVVRTADTGISAVIDGNGRTLSELKLGQPGALDVALPEPASTFTPFGRLGNLIPVSLALTAGSIAFLLRHWLKR
jgi:apolipoprotein N-acyltransferase